MKEYFSCGSATIGSKIKIPNVVTPITMNLGECIIRMNEYDYNVPHFHLESVDGSFECAICLLENKYYSHNGRIIQKLTREQCLRLHKVLSEPLDPGDNESAWDDLVDIWNMYNPYCKIDLERKRFPDYTNLDEFIDEFSESYFSTKNPYRKYSVIDFSEIHEPSNVLSFKIDKIGTCWVTVTSKYDSQAVPHFKVLSEFKSDNYKSLNTTLCIYSNQYCKDLYSDDDILTDEQLVILDDWLRSKNPKLRGDLTNWEHICNLWEMLNPDCIFPNKKKIKVQPDYKETRGVYNANI